MLSKVIFSLKNQKIIFNQVTLNKTKIDLKHSKKNIIKLEKYVDFVDEERPIAAQIIVVRMLILKVVINILM